MVDDKTKIENFGRIWKTGNSYVVTIPAKDVEEKKLKLGEKVFYTLRCSVSSNSNIHFQEYFNYNSSAFTFPTLT